MATTTSATVDPDRPPPLPLVSIPIIDLSRLSQSELFSLSMCSNSSFDLNRCDDVVIPKIHRSVFNESAASRKQTYSRLSLAPAQSSTSTKTTIHRRTPRLRSSHTPTPNNINDPEQVENSQIIRMLKELYKSDHNFQELVPLEVEIDTNVVVPELLNPEQSQKRKRGRPRKHENDVFIHPPDAKRKRNDTVKKLVAYDAVEDMEMVNSRGVKVNLENLGMLEDPYGLEIRRRTEGMSTNDELLGFLGGLNGDWGTRRKKRKVVDASYFGDALPKGWRLSLSIKKKAGRVWLFCRRYISPSGLQFESCKEVSKYLLCLVGEENLYKPTHTPSNNCDDFASKGASVKKDVSSSLSKDFKKEVKSNIVDPIDVHETKTCEASEAPTAEKAVDPVLLTEVPDIVVMETDDAPVIDKLISASPQSDHKISCATESEVNEHVHELNILENDNKGEHVKMNEDVSVEESGVDIEKETDEHVKMNDAPFDDKLISVSPQSDHKITESEVNENVHELNILDNDSKGEHVNMNEDLSVGEIEKETNDAAFDDKLISASPQSDHVGEINMNEDVLVEGSGVEIEKKCNEFLKRDKSPDVYDSKSDFSLTVDCIDDKCNKVLDDSIDIVEKDIVGVSNIENPVPETGVTHVDDTPKCILESGISSDELLESIEKNSVEVLNLATDSEKGIQENINICSPFDELKSEKKEELINENRITEVNKLFDSETLSLDSHNTNLKDSPQKLGFDFDENQFSYGIANSRVDTQDIGNKSNDQTQMIIKDFELENVNNASLNRSTQVNLDDFQIPSLGSSQNDLNLEFCSLVPNGNEQEFSFQDDDVTGIYENAHEGSERGLLDHFSITETSDDIFGNNASYSTPMDAFKFDEERDIGGAHQLSLNFGNSSHGHDLYQNTVQKKDDVQTNLTMVNEIKTQGFYPQLVANQSQQQSGNGVFRVDERYNNNNNNSNNNNDGFNLNGFRSSSSSRSEPVEFRFLTDRSQNIMNPHHHHHHLQGASSGGFPYNNTNTGIAMDQGFGSGFWSGKNGNMGGRNVITGVCAWCRNEFHMQQPGTQGGGIASLCPNCSAQVNML